MRRREQLLQLVANKIMQLNQSTMEELKQGKVKQLLNGYSTQSNYAPLFTAPPQAPTQQTEENIIIIEKTPSTPKLE